jgi:hypothetical protein
LRAVNALARPGEATGINHRDKAAQEVEIEHDQNPSIWIFTGTDYII